MLRGPPTNQPVIFCGCGTIRDLFKDGGFSEAASLPRGRLALSGEMELTVRLDGRAARERARSQLASERPLRPMCGNAGVGASRRQASRSPKRMAYCRGKPRC